MPRPPPWNRTGQRSVGIGADQCPAAMPHNAQNLSTAPESLSPIAQLRSCKQ
jgi:hypothetical protein